MIAASGGRVIVVGAGPVGLGAVLELARCGVRSVLIEKHDGISWHPKTRNFNTRTMEIARGWGAAVYQRLRAIDTPPGWKSPERRLEARLVRARPRRVAVGGDVRGRTARRKGSPASRCRTRSTCR
jgi:2-polyprenyl-6-methoxyphenol hydroxylase-like FAD-dependent oxidoreductase